MDTTAHFLWVISDDWEGFFFLEKCCILYLFNLVVPGDKNIITVSLKKACWVSLFVFVAQHICIFFQWLSLACDFTCLFCKVPWVWVGGSFPAPDEHRLRGPSLDRGPFCWRWVFVLFLSHSHGYLWTCITMCRLFWYNCKHYLKPLWVLCDQAKFAKLFSAWHF